MKHLLPFFLFSFFYLAVHGQNPDLKRTQHWYFGNYAGLDFTGGTLVPDNSGQMNVLERCAVISDTVGTLLFYTDGHQVWNRNHVIMENGDSLGLYFPTPRDAAVIIPKPGDDDVYYIFTVDGWENQFQRGIRWHEVDMTEDNGLGTVIGKNNLLHTPVTEQLAATRHANGCDYWVATHERSSDRFLAYRVTADGVDSIPVISSAGQDYAIAQLAYNLNGGGHLSFSPNGSKAIVQVYWSYPITGLPEQTQLLDFDNATGMFSGAFDLPVDTSASHGFFSPNGDKFYFTTGYSGVARLMQFDISSPDSVVVQNSRTIIFSSTVNFDADGQIGLDGKLYLTSEWDYLTSTPNPHFLSVIENPNASANDVNVLYAEQNLGNGRARQGLPNFVSNFLVDDAPAPCQYDLIDEMSDEIRSITVYPNPADEHISVLFEAVPTDDVSIRVLDITGRLWLNEKVLDLSNEINVSIIQIPNGIYLLELETDNHRNAFRIIINH